MDDDKTNLLGLLRGSRAAGSFSLRVTGDSMYPFLLPGDLLTLKKTRSSRYRSGDIVLVDDGVRSVIHRICYINRESVITRGDNCFLSDRKLASKRILARVEEVRRGNRTFRPDDLYLMQSTVYFGEIVRVKKLLEKKGIIPLFLKGLPVHLHVEKSHPHRLYADCDLLIPKDGAGVAASLLLSRGYRRLDYSLSRLHAALRNKPSDQVFFKQVNGQAVIFDLHEDINWMSQQLGGLAAFYPQAAIDRLTGEIYRGRQKVRLHRESFYIPGDAHLILFLALHMFHHNFRGASRLEFLDRVIRFTGGRRTFAELERNIVFYRLNAFVYPVFMQLRKHYRTPLPPSFLNHIRPGMPEGMFMKGMAQTPFCDDEPRIRAGMRRFVNLFLCSPEPVWKKGFVFLYPQVIVSLFFVLMKVFSFSPGQKQATPHPPPPGRAV